MLLEGELDVDAVVMVVVGRWREALENVRHKEAAVGGLGIVVP